MCETINVSNIDILSYVKEHPTFEVIGSPDLETVQWLCRDLIKIKANPMLWGDRSPPFFAMHSRNGFALIKREEVRQLIHTNELKKSDEVMCLQSYRTEVPESVMEALRVHSLWLYGLDPGPEYSDEQKFLMKERTKACFQFGSQKIKYVDKPGEYFEKECEA